MNPALEINFWARLLGILALEIICVIALAFALQSLTQSAFWRRTIWQISFVCLLLLASAEFTGAGRGVVIWLAGKPVPERTVSVRIIPTDVQFTVPSEEIEFPEPVFVPQKETPITHSVWWPGFLWLVGFGLIVARILFARVLFVVLRLRNQAIDDLILLRRISELASRLGIRRRIHLLESAGLTSPVAFGVVQPSIGLPSGFTQNFTEAQQNAMITHELAHLAARDPFWYLLADCAAAIFWWHPAIWFARRRLHSASEHAADEAAAILENGPGILAECLVQLGQQLSGSRSFGWLGVEGNGFRSHLGQRVERLLNLKETKTIKPRGWPLFFAKTAFTIFFGGVIIFTSGWFQSGKEQREKNFSTAVQKSWNGSFASMTLAAFANGKADSVSTDRSDVVEANPRWEAESAKSNSLNGEIQSMVWGGLFGEDFLLNPGKSPKTAEEIMAEVKEILPGIIFYESPLEKSPANPTWPPVLIHPAMPPKSVMTLDELPIGTKKVLPYFLSRELSQNKSTARTNPVDSSKGRQAIKAKLDRIRFREMQFEGVPLGEVLKNLSTESKRKDSENVGINFTFDPHSGASNFVDPNDITIHISPALKDVRLSELLDSIVQVADKPIRYKIEDYAVVFSPTTTKAIELYTRVFKLDSVKFLEKLKRFPDAITDKAFDWSLPFDDNSYGDESAPSNSPVQNRRFQSVTRTNRQQTVNVKVRQFLEAAGVEFDAPGNVNGKAVFFNDRSGTLMVRATLGDLEKIQNSVAPFGTAPPPPQVLIEAKFVEIDEATTKKLSLDWFTRSGVASLTNRTASDVFLSETIVTNAAGATLYSSNSLPAVTTIFTDAQYQVLLEALEKTDADILTAPKVTTLSGRQAQISVLDMEPIETSSLATNVDETTSSGAQILDVIPSVSPDGFAVQMTAIATLTEHLSYDKSSPTPVPQIRQRLFTDTVTIWDGQTFGFGTLYKNDLTAKAKNLFVFVTATIIDPAGNRVNAEEDMPFATNSIPKQPERK